MVVVQPSQLGLSPLCPFPCTSPYFSRKNHFFLSDHRRFLATGAGVCASAEPSSQTPWICPWWTQAGACAAPTCWSPFKGSLRAWCPRPTGAPCVFPAASGLLQGDSPVGLGPGVGCDTDLEAVTVLWRLGGSPPAGGALAVGSGPSAVAAPLKACAFLTSDKPSAQ